ncbi:hypothetical protein FRX31_021921 [Thalictrum thalictroides]|uniref:Uncharacterized protein n=1 Tax=Thalictrum thalictroides TaxID=46969 RepID=A0A7J6VUQ1_THATH|nr:hypothetical protein FRX31_021921 [Thalictrum thalictroides]
MEPYEQKWDRLMNNHATWEVYSNSLKDQLAELGTPIEEGTPVANDQEVLKDVSVVPSNAVVTEENPAE